MMKNDILDENNNMNIDKILRYLPDHMKERTKNILNRCKSVSECLYSYISSYNNIYKINIKSII
jgi:hypothetical protein